MLYFASADYKLIVSRNTRRSFAASRSRSVVIARKGVGGSGAVDKCAGSVCCNKGVSAALVVSVERVAVSSRMWLVSPMCAGSN